MQLLVEKLKREENKFLPMQHFTPDSFALTTIPINIAKTNTTPPTIHIMSVLDSLFEILGEGVLACGKFVLYGNIADNIVKDLLDTFTTTV